MTAQWHIVRVEPNREITVSSHLLGRRIRPFVPMVRESRRRSRPMLGPYVFALIDPDQPWCELSTIRLGRPMQIGDVVHSHYRSVSVGQRVRSVPGVIDFMRWPDTGHYATLSHCAVLEIAAYAFEIDNLAAEEKDDLVGHHVRTKDSAGCWSGLQGIVDRLDKKDRAAVRLILPDRQMTVSLPVQWLEPADDVSAQAARSRRIA